MTRFLVCCALFLFVFASCETHLSSYSSGNTKLDNTVAVHAVDSLVVPYRKAMTEQMAEVIGYADSALFSYAPESPLSNFVADVIFETGLDYSVQNSICKDSKQMFSLLNFGGIRTSLNQGNITRGEIYELMPFDNAIVILEIQPEKMESMTAYLDTMNGQPVSNAQFVFSEANREYVIGKNNAETYDSYFVVTSDYLAGGGDKMSFFNQPLNRWDTGILVRDALIGFIEKSDTVHYKNIEGRMYYP